MVEEFVKKSVALPSGFNAEISGLAIMVTGNGKSVSREFKARGITIGKGDSSILLVGKPASRKMNALLNSIAAHIQNIVNGLQQEHVYALKIIFSHFPMNVSVNGDTVEINNFLGEKQARHARILPGAKVEVKGKDVFVKGSDKEAVGQTAANIENATKVKGKDRRIYQDGIFIVEKAKAKASAEQKGGEKK